MRNQIRRFTFFLALLAGVCCTSSALATSASWTGAASALWSDTNNWSGLPVTVPSAGEAATYNAASVNTTIDLGAGATVGTNVFDTVSAAAYTIGAGGTGVQTLTLSAPGAITVNSTVASSQLFNANLSLGTAGGAKSFNFVNNSAGATLTLAGGIGTTQTGTNTLTFSGAGTTTISGPISNGSGAIALVKGNNGGGGVLVLAGSNNIASASFSVVGNPAGTQDDGVIRLAHSDALTGATVTMNGQNDTTQTIELTNNITVTNAISSRSRDPGRPTLRNVGGTNTYSGAFTATATGGGITFESAAGKLNLSGSFSQTAGSARGLTLQGAADGEISYSLTSANVSSITKSNAGTWTLSGNNTYTGGTIINAGTINMAHPAGLGGASTITFNGTANATLNIATDGGDTAYAVTAGSGTTWTIASDVKTGSAGINHTLGAVSVGSGSPALQMNITRGPNVLSGNPRITTGVLTLSGGLGGATIINPTTADITIPSVTSTSSSKTLQLDGTSAGNQITGAIANGANLVTLVKSGASTWTLSGANTYTGNTTISNGTLALTGSGAIISTNITVISGGTLDVSAISFALAGHQSLIGNGTVNGNLSDSAGAQLIPGGNSTVGQLTVNNNLTLAGGGTIRFDFATGTNDILVVGGNLSPSGTTTVNLASLPPGGLVNGTYTLMKVTGTLGGTAGNFALSGAPSGRQAFSIAYDSVSSPKRVLLQVTGSPAPLVWRGVGSAWDIVTSLNWTNTAAGSNDFYFDGDNVSFTDLGTAISPVLNVTVLPTTTTFNSSGNYTLTGTGKISGGGSLTKSGSGTVTIQTTNDYSGVTAINGGTVSVDNVANGGVASALGAAASASANLTFNGGKLQFTSLAGSTDRGATLNASGATLEVSDPSGVLSVNGAMTGTGALTKTGNGILALGGANNYGSNTVVNAGTLTVNGGNAIPDASAVTLADVSGVTLNLGANETIGSLAGGGVNGGNVSLNANRLTLGANNATTTYAGNISGTGGITKTGSGTFTLTGGNSFSGNLFAKSGTLVIDPGASVSGITTWVSIGQDGTDNATLTLKGSLATTYEFNVGDIGSSAGTLNIEDGASLSVGSLFVASANAAGSSATGTVNQTGGTVSQTSTALGAFVIGGRVSTNGVAIYNLSGGQITAASPVRMSANGSCTFNQTGGTFTSASTQGGINLQRFAGPGGTYNLNGGIAQFWNIAASVPSTDPTYKSVFNFNGGTLQPTANNTANYMQGLSRANVRNGGAIIDTAGYNITINQALMHSDIGGDNAIDGGLTKNNSGILTLTATNTYTGPTVVNGGTLAVNGSLGSGAVTVSSGAILGGNGVLNGATTVQSGGTITPGANVGVLTVSNNLTLDSATAIFNFTSSSNSTITVSGALNVPNFTTINLNFISAVPPVGTNTLIRYSSLSGASFANLSVGTTNPRYSFSLYNDTVAKEVKLVVAGVPAALTWVGDGSLNAWDNTSTYQNWLNGASPDFFFDGDNVTFNNNGSNTPAVNLLNNVFPASVTVNSTQDYEFGGSGSIASPGNLTKSGTSTLILSTSNSYAGAAVINAGTVQVGNAGTAGMLVAGSITNNSALTFNRSDVITLSSPVAGTGSFTQNGTSDLLLNASNTFSGPVVVNTGFVKPRNAYAFGSAASGTYATNGGQIYFDLNLDSPEEPFVLGGAALRKGGGGVSTLGGQLTLVSNSTIQVDGGATLNLTNAAGIAGSGASLTLQGDGGSAGNVAGPLVLGSGGVTKGGTGTWTLGTNNSYAGLTTINAGTLRISDNTVGNPASFTANQVTLAGGTLTATTNVSFIGGNVGFAVTGTTGGFGVEAGATLTISNDISGTGTLTKFGPGTLALVGPNTFSGTLNLDSFINTGNDGAVLVTTSNALASVASPIYSRNNNGGVSTLQLNGGVGIAQNFVASCRNSGVAWLQNLAGNNTLHGIVQVEVGGGTLPFQSDAGLLTIANNIEYIGASTSGRTYQFGGAGNTLVSGVILNGNNTAPVSLSKVGTGTLTLSAANTYLGATTINNGLLSLTGSISSTGAVSVVGGALGGTGSITDNVSVGAAGALAPGVNGIGTLTINGNLSLAGNLAIDVNRSASPTNDAFIVSGTLANTGAGVVTVSNLGPALVAGNSFKLFSQPVVNGGAMSITGGVGAGLGWTNKLAVDGSIAVITVSTIATNPTNITFNVSGGNVNLSWPGTHLGWILQTQTNSRSIGLATNWFDVPGSASTTATNFPVSPANPTVFFRLRSP